MFAWRTFPASRDATPGAYLTVPALRSAGIRVAFTGRTGGSSDAPYSSLNLSYVSGDDAASVAANRARALAAIGMDLDAWTSGRQVHGAHVEAVTDAERGRGRLDPDDTIEATDALWTDVPRVALAVLTADCVPLAIADPVARRIAVVHAGWRGLVGGVIEAAARAFEDPARAVAFVGPSIGPCCYEVGEDVAAPASEALGAGVVQRRDDATYVDLWGGARVALRRAGIGAAWASALCTRCEPHRFFSHRAGDAGRQGLLVAIEP